MNILFKDLHLLIAGVFLIFGCNKGNPSPDQKEKFLNYSSSIYTLYNYNPYLKLVHLLDIKSIIQLDKDKKYGLTKEIKNLSKGNFVSASVQFKTLEGKGQFVGVVKKDSSVKVIRQLPIKEKIDWQNLNIELYIDQDSTTVQFYSFTGEDAVLCKNLKIKCFESIPKPIKKHKQYLISDLKLFIPNKSANKLEAYKNDALAKGVISKSNKKYETAFLITEADSLPIKIRLKGDWTDHLSSGKESYRIKISTESAFLGKRSFSIQNPKTRNYMHEWFMHKLCLRENLLSTHYEFINVYVNGIYKGVYAIEEHFEKQLLESKNSREAPILKFDESGLWSLTKLNKKLSSSRKLPVFESSNILPFKKGKVKKDENLKNLFIEGAKLVELYKNLYSNVKSIFDIKKMAKYYALLELGNVVHGHQWHNKRFYFNPITQKMENIGFDMNPGKNVNDDLYILKKLKSKEGLKEWSLILPYLRNKDFKKYYIKYLKKYSDVNYLNKIFKIFSEEIRAYENLLANEINEFSFDTSFYYRRASLIRSKIEHLNSYWEGKFLKERKNLLFSNSYYTNSSTENPIIKDVSLNGYLKELDSNLFEIEINNYALIPILIKGYEGIEKEILLFEKPIVINSFSFNTSSRKILVQSNPKKILFTTSKNDTVLFKKKILPWPKPSGQTARMELEEKFNIKSPYYTVKDSNITFKRKHLIINDIVYIPEGYHVVIKQGTTIDFQTIGGIISASSILIHGNANSMVKITSSSSTSNGITILNGKSTIFENVIFENLRSLNYKNWNLSGGISIYESDVKIDNCIIKNGLSEDAINIINSSFNINNLTIDSTNSDGLDSDFCNGEITNSYFNNTGNDGLDFSGSDVEISDVTICNAGDKGISCGEKSLIKVRSTKVKSSKIGIAVKDESKTYIENVKLIDMGIAIAVFKKKTEYKSPEAFVDNVFLFNTKMPLYLDNWCFANYKGTRFTSLK